MHDVFMEKLPHMRTLPPEVKKAFSLTIDRQSDKGKKKGVPSQMLRS